MAFVVRNGKVTNVREYLDTLAVARAFEMEVSTSVSKSRCFGKADL